MMRLRLAPRCSAARFRSSSCAAASIAAVADSEGGGRPGLVRSALINNALPVHADRLGREAHRFGRGGDRQRVRADLRRAARDPPPAQRARDRPAARRDPRSVSSALSSSPAASRSGAGGRSPGTLAIVVASFSYALGTSTRQASVSERQRRRCARDRLDDLAAASSSSRSRLASFPTRSPSWEAIASVAALTDPRHRLRQLIFYYRMLMLLRRLPRLLVTYLIPPVARDLRRCDPRRAHHPNVIGRTACSSSAASRSGPAPSTRPPPRRRRPRPLASMRSVEGEGFRLRRAEPGDAEFLAGLVSQRGGGSRSLLPSRRETSTASSRRSSATPRRPRRSTVASSSRPRRTARSGPSARSPS